MKYLDPKFKESDKETGHTETSDNAAESAVDETGESGSDGVTETVTEVERSADAEAESADELGGGENADSNESLQIPPPSGWEAVAERGLSAINLIAIAGGVLISLNLLEPGPLRAIAATILVTAGPGTGLVRLLNRFDVLIQYVFAIGVSVAISVLTAQALLSLGSIGVLEAAIPLTVIAAIRPLTWLIKSARTSSKDDKDKTAEETPDTDDLGDDFSDEQNEGRLEP